MNIINNATLNKILKKIKVKIISINNLNQKDNSYVEINIKGILKIKKESILKKAPKWFIDWSNNFENKINKRFNKIEKEIVEIKKDIIAMKNTPIMKRELNLK